MPNRTEATMRRPAPLIAAALLIVGAPAAHAFNFGFLQSSVLQVLTPEDIEIGTRATADALESGENREWSNPSTGASGAIRILVTQDIGPYEDCRRARMSVAAGGRSGSGTYDLCRTRTGSWVFYNGRR
jgi:surface antigen